MKDRLEELFARYVDQRVLHDKRISVEELCRDCPELAEELGACIRQYEMLDTLLAPSPDPTSDAEEPKEEDLPRFEGFRTIEQIGRGGGGRVYKLQDLKLERMVAAKVLRPDSRLKTTFNDFLREARALALFDDTRIVRIFDFRPEASPPFLLMEYVDGFQLDKLGQSLEYSQRARIMAEIADAIHGAHERGIQHRDLKPANILLDAKLCPKILDFGLSHSDEDLGHGKGTLPYMAPEQINPGRAIDDRTDVYALGVVFYELLSGVLPYKGETTKETIDAITQGMPKLPVEIDPAIPEPLQAIALKAMERDPDARYATAKEMALDLLRYLSGRPILARPTLYQSTLDQRVRPHREQIRDWLELKLIYPHEAGTLQRAYDRLESREEDWIVQSRVLSFSQISLYLGAFLLVCGGLLYSGAYFMDAVAGLAKPFLVLGVPLITLNALALLLFGRGRQAVAIAFFLASAVLLPLVLLIIFNEGGWWGSPVDTARQFFEDGPLSNRQLQVAGLLSCIWAFWLAFRTRTTALSSVVIVMATFFHLTILTDFGLRTWLDEGMWDTFACSLLPLLLFLVVFGAVTERKKQSWFAQPVYITAVGLFVIIMELLALDGKLFSHLGISLAQLQPETVANRTLLDTLAAMTLNGLLFYLTGWLLDRRGTALLKLPAQLLFIISPFSILEPICYLNDKQPDYAEFYNWFYLFLSVTIAYLSRFRQRKSFYFAGLINCGIAIWMITDRREWFDNSKWGLAVVIVSLSVLAIGYSLNVRERRRRPSA